ncbi:hypothetical protein ABZ883_03135 [Streptomyces sp. NPDC046977]|uniref:hypothetical protein n=1 Tax=Streptomyces sp. NPDC046977 TaxID=3154703 RepID=UPI0033F7D07F
MSNGFQGALRSRLVRWFLAVILSFVVAAIFVPLCLALLPGSLADSLSDAAVGWIVLVAGVALSTVVLWWTSSRDDAQGRN